MRPIAIRYGQKQFAEAKCNSMRPSIIRSGQVQFAATKCNLMRPSEAQVRIPLMTKES
ncbi:hypothetical protein RHMOL_Rhmol03G0006000 [Rhododendron molle]|uniref:Uncharacterized protein n=1 Tax=Rhododendron molle TaxID=49168 RepID=A0ACC0PAM0_RHOML|nr:hypothetical protein RHMOL_Rhmol03G0006000 [Rhododendron molle]